MKTTYFTHFRSAAEHGLAILKSERGLATELFLGVKALEKEKGFDNLKAEFEKAMIDIETEFKKHLDEGETLSSAVPAFKARKSAILRSIKAGINPKDFDNFRKFVDAVKKDEAKATSNGKSYTPHDNTGGVDGTGFGNGTVKEVTSNMPSKVRERLNLFIKHLEKADEATALDVISKADGALHAKLRKAGGAFANVKKATA